MWLPCNWIRKECDCYSLETDTEKEKERERERERERKKKKKKRKRKREREEMEANQKPIAGSSRASHTHDDHVDPANKKEKKSNIEIKIKKGTISGFAHFGLDQVLPSCT